MALFRYEHVFAALLITSACATEPGIDGDGSSDGTSSSNPSSSSSPSSSSATTTPTSSTADGGGSGDGPATSGPPNCDGGSDDFGGSSDDGIVGMDDDMPLETLTAEVRQGEIMSRTWVEIRDLVVTTGPAPNEWGVGWDVFVQDPAGGPWSGLRVRLRNDPGDSLDVGDSVDVIGVVRDRQSYFFVDIARPDEDEVAVLGSGTAPTPPVVSIDDLTLDNETGRAYEGMPIRIEQAEVTDDDLCSGEFVLEDTVRVDDRFAPGQIVAPPVGATLSTVGGVLIYASDAFELAPRDLTELDGM